MDNNTQQAAINIQLLKKRRVLRGIKRLQLVVVAVVFSTILIAYFNPNTPTTVFISFFAFLLVQVFATREYAELVQLTRNIKLLAGGPYFPQQPVKVSWTIPAGAAVRDTYFFLLIFFDVSWLAHAYLYPTPANSYSQFLRQLAIGPISGTAFVIFTIALWAFYFYLFVIGLVYSDELNSVDNPLNEEKADDKRIMPQEVWFKVNDTGHDEIFLQGKRLQNQSKQPLILWPGFYQNGYVYDLSEEASLAHYLWQNDFDVWIIHPRGTADSDGCKQRASLDDFAGEDMPCVVDRVAAITGAKPVFVGHSQGGISAIISMEGACKQKTSVSLSDIAASERQQALKGLVTLGSFLNFTFSKPSWLKNFVSQGLCIKIGKSRIRLISASKLLGFTNRFAFLGTPFSFGLRMSLLNSKRMRLLLFPLTGLLNMISLLKLWEFLYHVPNVSRTNRKGLFYKTMDGTFSGIVQQFYHAVATGSMCSINNTLNYSGNYNRLTLPVSIVAMEFDTLADPVMMKEQMFDAISSEQKHFTVWKGVGHEDHFTDPAYFPQVLDAIQKVC